MKNVLKNIISLLVVVLYLISTTGFGVHKCYDSGAIKTILLLQSSASCKDIHSNEDLCKHICNYSCNKDNFYCDNDCIINYNKGKITENNICCIANSCFLAIAGLVNCDDFNDSADCLFPANSLGITNEHININCSTIKYRDVEFYKKIPDKVKINKKVCSYII